jgi:hypothetical protein
MSNSQSKTLRITVIVILVLLVIQYELGIAVNIANPAAQPPFSFSLSAVSDALNKVGGASLPHAILGAWLVLLSLLNLVLSLGSRIRSVQIFGSLVFLSILIAAGGGLFFTLSGFQDDNATHAMATNFILAFIFSFLELYNLKPQAGPRNNYV